MLDEALTIPRVLARRRATDALLQAIVCDEDAVTWGELDEASRALAGRLVAAGIGKGDRLALLAQNGIAWVTIALAAMRVGVVLVPLSTLLRAPELLAQLGIAAVTHLVAVRSYRGRAYLDELDAAAPALRERTRSGRRDPLLPALRRIWAPDEIPAAPAPPGMIAALEDVVRPADDMVVLFTSGSRGAPKGVIHTHGGALRAVASGLDARCVHAGERLYIPMPLFWTGGFCGGLLSVLLAGATLLTEAAPEPGRTIGFLARERATLFRGWPDQAARLAAHPAFATADLGTLRPGSLPAVLPPALRPAPGARANLFGMTESAGPYCGAPLDRDLPAGAHGSCGRPFAAVEVRVVEPATGAALPPGVAGEIRLRGPGMMRGICGRTRTELLDRAGFYATGDLGRLDEDGYLWFAGRLDDMVKISGATVYPVEVETALRALPGVAQAFVTDVAAADGGREIAALVVSREDPESIASALRARLSAFKVPTRWLVVSDPAEVPLSPTGKIVKQDLQRLVQTRGVRATGAARPRAAGER